MKTNVYVDGFNLYFGCFKNKLHPQDRQFKWLNLDAMMALALPNDDIQRIKYFTAMVKNTQGDTGKESRQRVYLRALRTIPHLTVHEGRFLKSRKTGLLITPQGVVTSMLRTVETREEKGSDVSGALNKATTFYREIRRSDLARCQFPATMHDIRGSFFKPPAW